MVSHCHQGKDPTSSVSPKPTFVGNHPLVLPPASSGATPIFFVHLSASGMDPSLPFHGFQLHSCLCWKALFTSPALVNSYAPRAGLSLAAFPSEAPTDSFSPPLLTPSLPYSTYSCDWGDSLPPAHLPNNAVSSTRAGPCLLGSRSLFPA